MASDSPSAITPRTIGRRKMRCRTIADSTRFDTWAIAPSGFRTATAQFDGPRIITPSRTACPPIGFAMCLRGLAAPRAAGALEPPLEALHPAAGIHQLLLAGVERMAGRADFDVQLGLR